jgi:hypothetical protein
MARRLPGQFVWRPVAERHPNVGKKNLTENSKKTRDQAEVSFSRTQTQFLARSRITSEYDAATQARETKTARLRELRLEKEANDMSAAAAVPKRLAKR